MLKNLRLRSKTVLLAFVLSFLVFASEGAYAQYCDMTSTGYWYQASPSLTGVEVNEVTTSNVFVKKIASNLNTGWDQYKNFGEKYTGGAEGVQLGRRYQVVASGMTSANGYTGYLRVWMDLNANGKWSDAGEFLGYAIIYTGALDYNTFTYSVSPWSVNGFYFNVPCTAPLSKTRLRVMVGYTYLGSVSISDPCVISYYDSPSYTFGKYYYGEVEDYEFQILPDAPKSIPSDQVVLNSLGAIVENNTIWKAGQTYSGAWSGSTVTTPTPGPSLQFATAPAGSIVQMAIQGPLPSTTTVWTALNASLSSTITLAGTDYTSIVDSDGKTRFTFAPKFSSGAFSPTSTGDFKGTSGGEYKFIIQVAGAGCAGAANRLFTVSWPNDMAVSSISSPLNNDYPKYAKYGVGQTVKIEGIFQNVGLNDCDKFKAIYTIRNSSSQTVYQDSAMYDPQLDPAFTILHPGDKTPFLLAYKKFFAPGIFTMEMAVSRDAGLDDEPYNNTYPRPNTTTYVFEIAYDIELAASQIFAPAQGDVLIANRTYKGSAEFKNNGISLASGVPVSMEIFKLGKTTPEWTSNNIQISDIQYGRYNTKTVSFGEFSLKDAGQYRAKITVRAPEDIVYGNDTMSIYFTVETGIQGTYTVGTLKESVNGFSVDRNFASIQEMSNAIFYNGISGPVTFEFTDANYNVSTTTSNVAAWDLSSKILGLGYDATTGITNSITFKPASTREGIRGGVQFNLSSPSGVGIRLGQSNNSSSNNDYAIFRSFANTKNSNNAGYISFLGGPQKAFKFVISNTSSAPTHASAFYLNAGSNNIAIKNCLIDNGNASTTKLTRLPNVDFNTLGNFKFEEDYPNQNATPTGLNSATFSAGIVQRAVSLEIAPASGTTSAFSFDSIPANNNVFDNNEISNFGYGIVSLGYGAFRIAGTNNFKEYYNNNNTISNNQIYNIARAGIFVGFERNSTIKNNRIWNVGNGPAYATEAAGIQAGGMNISSAVQGGYNIGGYNNYELKIDGNQVSDLTSSLISIGVWNEQTRRIYNAGNVFTYYPKTENAKISNNVVWNLSSNNIASASKVGIANVTTRSTASFFTPFVAGYHTVGDLIANNTIIINSAQATTTGNIIGIASAQTDNVGIYSNAIAISVPSFVPTVSTVGAAIYYEGYAINKNLGLTSNRNIFFTGNANPKLSNIDVLRHREVNANDVLMVTGSNGEYRTLGQVQAWFGSNENSLYGDFSNDLALSVTTPAMYNVKDASLLTKGSLLNNRGENIAWVGTDSRGVTRGSGGERYDIGAFEFVAPLYQEDMEINNVNSPRAYQSLSGQFSDAEYIMTTSPTTVKAIVRNNGKLPQSAYRVVANIYRESAVTPGTFETTPRASTTTTVALGSSESIEVSFPSFTFAPQTYAELASNVPAYSSGSFSSMQANVTPLYKIEYVGGSDEWNPNNIISKVVRYYIKKSDLSIIGSGRFQSVNIYTTANASAQIGNLNAAALETGFGKLNWKIDNTNKVYNYDRFERNAWEPRAVNYNNYLHLFWSDADADTPSIYEIIDINNFLAKKDAYKRNLIVASQEIVGNTKVSDDNFRANVLRADLDPLFGNTLGTNNTFFGRIIAPVAGSNYHNRQITGVNIARDFKMNATMPLNTNVVPSATFSLDKASFPAVLTSVNGAAYPGLTKDGFAYTDAATPTKPIMGVATTNVERNVITLGMDWRHFGDIETMMRGIVDYVAKNTDIVPVELVDFKATKVGQKVVLDWATASENNSSKFEVEKAVVSQTGSQEFNKVAELAAAGKSTQVKFYGPVTDYDVVPNTTYAYKLRMVDRNGEFAYSDVRLVVMNSENGLITLGDAQPNPASNSTKVKFTLSQPNSVNITLYDVNGKALDAVSSFYSTGEHFYTPDISKLASGAYTVVLKSGELVLTKSFNVVK